MERRAEASARCGNQWKTILKPAYRPQLILCILIPALHQMTGATASSFTARSSSRPWARRAARRRPSALVGSAADARRRRSLLPAPVPSLPAASPSFKSQTRQARVKSVLSSTTHARLRTRARFRRPSRARAVSLSQANGSRRSGLGARRVARRAVQRVAQRLHNRRRAHWRVGRWSPRHRQR